MGVNVVVQYSITCYQYCIHSNNMILDILQRRVQKDLREWHLTKKPREQILLRVAHLFLCGVLVKCRAVPRPPPSAPFLTLLLRRALRAALLMPLLLGCFLREAPCRAASLTGAQCTGAFSLAPLLCGAPHRARPATCVAKANTCVGVSF